MDEIAEAVEAEARTLAFLFVQNLERIARACDTGQLAHVDLNPNANPRDQMDQLRAVLSAVGVSVEN